MLAARGLSATVADARFAKPLDEDLILRLAREHEALITVEEGAVGGFGAFVLQPLAEHGALDRGLKVRTLILPDIFQDQDKPEADVRPGRPRRRRHRPRGAGGAGRRQRHRRPAGALASTSAAALGGLKRTDHSPLPERGPRLDATPDHELSSIRISAGERRPSARRGMEAACRP